MNTPLPLPVPSADDVRTARLAAGHTQAQAAALMGYAHQVRLAEIETGARPADPIKWERYLLATDLHPTHRLIPRR